MSDRDYYNVLGVERDATPDDIKRAYRRLAMRWHPDRNGDDAFAEVRFKHINEAHRVLADPDERARYDRMGPLFQPDGQPPSPDDARQVMSRMWDNLFGRRRNPPGEDLRYTVSVTLEEVCSGTSKEIVVPRKVRCGDCDGLGAPREQREVCDVCDGSGRATGPRILRSRCYHCEGKGFVALASCDTCGGEGRVGQEETLKVKVPPGVATGSRLKVGSKGNEPPGDGPTGHLFVIVDVAEHALFRRRGDDVLAAVPVPFRDAALGADVRVPTLEGATAIRVPPGTPHGQVFRLTARGLPRFRKGGRGDLLYEVTLSVPAELTDDERVRLEAWAATLPSDRHPEVAAFRDAVEAR